MNGPRDKSSFQVDNKVAPVTHSFRRSNEYRLDNINQIQFTAGGNVRFKATVLQVSTVSVHTHTHTLFNGVTRCWKNNLCMILLQL